MVASMVSWYGIAVWNRGMVSLYGIAISVWYRGMVSRDVYGIAVWFKRGMVSRYGISQYGIRCRRNIGDPEKNHKKYLLHKQNLQVRRSVEVCGGGWRRVEEVVV